MNGKSPQVSPVHITPDAFAQVSAVVEGLGTGSSTELHTACAHATQRVPHQPTGYPQGLWTNG